MNAITTILTVLFWGLAVTLAPQTWMASGCPSWRTLLADGDE